MNESRSGSGHDEHRRRQQDVLDRVLRVLRGSSDVLGLTASGSYSRNEHDAFSDLDLDCYLIDEERSGRLELHALIANVAPALATLFIYDLNRLYLFENGVRLDLNYQRPSAIEAQDPADQILYDPEGRLGRDMGCSFTAPDAKHPANWSSGDPLFVDWFFWMFRQAFCQAQRGAQGDHRWFGKLAGAADSLHQVRTRLVDMRMWTLQKSPWYLGLADLEFVAIIEATYPYLKPADLKRCTLRLVDAFEYAAPEYCAKAKIAYPAEKTAVLRFMLDEFDRLQPEGEVVAERFGPGRAWNERS